MRDVFAASHPGKQALTGIIPTSCQADRQKWLLPTSDTTLTCRNSAFITSGLHHCTLSGLLNTLFSPITIATGTTFPTLSGN